MIEDNIQGADSVAAGYVDDDWADQYDGMNDAGEDAPKLSGQTIPSFSYYVVRFDKGKGAATNNTKTPMARTSCVVLEGPDGTVGERVFDDLFLRVSKTAVVDNVKVPKDAEKYAEDLTNFRKKLNKIARVGGFELTHPTNGSLEAIDAYAKQFEQNGGFTAVVEIREGTNTYNGVSSLRNRIIWESLRATGDPASGKKAKPGATAYDEAVEKIAERNKVIAAKTQNAGRTAGSVAGRNKGLSD